MSSTLVVSFDAGNTLVKCDPPPPEIYARHLSKLGRKVSSDEAEKAFSTVWVRMQANVPEGVNRYEAAGGELEWWREFVRGVVKELKHDADPDELFASLYQAFSDPTLWKPFPDVFPVLDRLAESGIRMCVVSNWDSKLPAILEAAGLSKYFDHILVSAIEGVEKPNPEIFRRAAQRVGVECEMLLHVGDSPREDLEGARAAGCRAVLLDRAGLFDGTHMPRIRELTQLPQLVGVKL